MPYRIKHILDALAVGFIRGAAWLAGVGSTPPRGKGLLVFWPRVESPNEARELIWRARFYFPEFERLFWLREAAREDDPPRPEHMGPVEAADGDRVVCRPLRFWLQCRRVVQHRATVARWKSDPKPSTIFRRVIERAIPHVTLDRRADPKEGYAQIALRNRLIGHQADIEAARERLHAYLDELPKWDKCYVFGTGPSLSLADQLSFDDGYRVVCNTIVRDAELLRRVRPHFIAAADPIYHFGCSRYSHAFRADLRQALREHDTRFVYPAMFDELARRFELSPPNQAIPVPIADKGSGLEFNLDLRANFALPRVGNVMNLLLLPLSTTLAPNVCFLGFDGRAPNNQFFWNYSTKHTYDDEFPTLREAYPAFFDRTDYKAYQSKVMGEESERLFARGEATGARYCPMTPSWSPAMARRHRLGWHETWPDPRERELLAEWEREFVAARDDTTPAAAT